LIGPIEESTQKSNPSGLNAADAVAAGPATDTPSGSKIASDSSADRLNQEPGLRVLRRPFCVFRLITPRIYFGLSSSAEFRPCRTVTVRRAHIEMDATDGRAFAPYRVIDTGA
jgi:hypothetical protein